MQGPIRNLTQGPNSLAVLGLIGYVFVALIGILALLFAGREANEALIATMGAAVGALSQRINAEPPSTPDPPPDKP